MGGAPRGWEGRLLWLLTGHAPAAQALAGLRPWLEGRPLGWLGEAPLVAWAPGVGGALGLPCGRPPAAGAVGQHAAGLSADVADGYTDTRGAAAGRVAGGAAAAGRAPGELTVD